jgi:hypothetical protein
LLFFASGKKLGEQHTSRVLFLHISRELFNSQENSLLKYNRGILADRKIVRLNYVNFLAIFTADIKK